MKPVHVPEEWDDNDLLTFEQFCELIHRKPRTVYDWRRTGRGPTFERPEGTSRLFIRVGEIRRWLGLPTTHHPAPPAEPDPISQTDGPTRSNRADDPHGSVDDQDSHPLDHTEREDGADG